VDVQRDGACRIPMAHAIRQNDSSNVVATGKYRGEVASLIGAGDLALVTLATHKLSRTISRDSVTKQGQFADKHSFDYPLLSDADGRVADAFGVARGRVGQRLGAAVRRRTFVIGTDRRLITEIASETRMDRHADDALIALAAARS